VNDDADKGAVGGADQAARTPGAVGEPFDPPGVQLGGLADHLDGVVAEASHPIDAPGDVLAVVDELVVGVLELAHVTSRHHQLRSVAPAAAGGGGNSRTIGSL